MRQRRWWAVCVALGAALPLSGSLAQAQVSYSVVDSIHTQDFDSLPNSPTNTSLGASPAGWIDDTAAPGAGNFSILGWHLYHPISVTEGGANGHQRMRIGNGSANTGAFWSFGDASSTDRALGSFGAATVASATQNMHRGLRLVNDTDQTLTGFKLIYDGEQWRNSSTGTAETLSFDYSLTADTSNWFSSTDFNGVSTLNFVAPVTGTTVGAVDGNGVGRVADITGYVTDISWDPGAELWLRWADPGGLTASNDGLAIDNVRFTAGLNIVDPTRITSVMSGLASSASTWSNNQVPSSGNTYRALNGHTVTVDAPFAGTELRAESGGTLHFEASGSGVHVPNMIIDTGGDLTKNASGNFYLGDIFASSLGKLEMNADVTFDIDAGTEFGLDMTLQGTGNIDFEAGAGSRLILTDAAGHDGTIRFNGQGDQVRLTEATSGGFGTLEMNSTGANTVYYNAGEQAASGRLIFNQPGTMDHAATQTSPTQRRLHGASVLVANAAVTVDLTTGFPNNSAPIEERRLLIGSGLEGSGDINILGTAVDYTDGAAISHNEFEFGSSGDPPNAVTDPYSGTITATDFVDLEIRHHLPDARFVINNNARLEMGHQAIASAHSMRFGEVLVNDGGTLEVGFEQTSDTGEAGHHAYTLSLTSKGSRDGSLTLASGSTTRMQVNGTATGEFDRILANGDVQLGGTLNVLVNPPASSDTNPTWTPSIGQTFNIIQIAPESPSGDYDHSGTVDDDDYDFWQARFGTDDAAADGNLNGIVDAADYVIWRKNFGAMGGIDATITGMFNDVVVTDFNGAMTGFGFQVNYSSTLVQLEVVLAGSGSVAAVPEPTTLALLGLLLPLLATGSRTLRHYAE